VRPTVHKLAVDGWPLSPIRPQPFTVNEDNPSWYHHVSEACDLLQIGATCEVVLDLTQPVRGRFCWCVGPKGLFVDTDGAAYYRALSTAVAEYRLAQAAARLLDPDTPDPMETGELLGRLRLAADTLTGYPDAAADMNRRRTPLTRAAREAVNRLRADRDRTRRHWTACRLTAELAEAGDELPESFTAALLDTGQIDQAAAQALAGGHDPDQVTAWADAWWAREADAAAQVVIAYQPGPGFTPVADLLTSVYDAVTGPGRLMVAVVDKALADWLPLYLSDERPVEIASCHLLGPASPADTRQVLTVAAQLAAEHPTWGDGTPGAAPAAALQVARDLHT